MPATYTPVQSVSFMGTYPLKHYRLQNGLEIYLLHNPQSPVLTYLTHYTVGSALEEDAERGLAHFFEHMMFRETDTLADGDFDRIMSEAGGVGLNAYTTYDHTSYFVSVPTAQVQRVIDLEADRMANLKLSPELIEAERGAVLGEMHMYQDMPSEELWHAMTAAAFPSHPYRHPIIGYEDQVKAFNGPDFERFYSRHYAPNRAVLVIAGAFDEAALLESLKKAYGHLPEGAKRPTPRPPEGPWQSRGLVRLKNPKISTENLMMVWQTPGLTHPDTPALILLGTILSGGQSSPLYRAIVQAGLGTHVSAGNLDADMTLQSPGLFLIDAGLQQGVSADQALAVINDVLENLMSNGIGEEDFERALNQSRLGSYTALRSNSQMARQIASFAVACGDPLYGEKLLAKMEALDTNTVHQALRTYLREFTPLTIIQQPAGKTSGGPGQEKP